jgi:hypothetical protein
VKVTQAINVMRVEYSLTARHGGGVFLTMLEKKAQGQDYRSHHANHDQLPQQHVFRAASSDIARLSTSELQIHRGDSKAVHRVSPRSHRKTSKSDGSSKQRRQREAVETIPEDDIAQVTCCHGSRIISLG